MSGIGATEAALAASAVALCAGLTYAAWRDWRTREVSDTLWLVLSLVGAALGLVPFLSAAAESGPLGGRLGLVLWAVVSAFVVEHLVPWDEALAERHPDLPGVIELVLYLVIGAAVFGGAFFYGIGSGGVPLAAIAVYIAIVFARALFEVGLLYGGADAKAIMVAGLLVPLLADPPLAPAGPARALLGVYPFAVTLLMNAALLSLAVPISLAVRNLRRGHFEFPRAFTGYSLPVTELSRRFVWIKDPTFDRESEEAAAETSEDDQKLRERRQAELLAQGVQTVWVTPQLPFVVLLAAGAVTAALFGNLLFDLVQLL